MLDAYILALALTVLPVDIESSIPDPRVPALVAEFRSNSFRRREAAHHQIRKIGRGAQFWLESYNNDRDPEVRYRCHNLLEELYAVPSLPDGLPMPRLCALAGPSQKHPHTQPPAQQSRGFIIWWYQCRSTFERHEDTPLCWREWTERNATYLLMRDLRRAGASWESVARLLEDMRWRTDPVPYGCPRCPQWIAKHWGYTVP